MTKFLARADELPFLLAYVERRCSQLGLPQACGLRAVLIFEELFVNVIRHGVRRGVGAGFVEIELSVEGEELELCFEDGGVAFDPLLRTGQSAHELPAGERPVGGLGLTLIEGFARHREYRRSEDRNCIRIRLSRDAD